MAISRNFRLSPSESFLTARSVVLKAAREYGLVVSFDELTEGRMVTVCNPVKNRTTDARRSADHFFRDVSAVHSAVLKAVDENRRDSKNLLEHGMALERLKAELLGIAKGEIRPPIKPTRRG